MIVLGAEQLRKLWSWKDEEMPSWWHPGVIFEIDDGSKIYALFDFDSDGFPRKRVSIEDIKRWD